MQRCHAMPFGAKVDGEGVRFAFWAPSARQVSLRCDGVVHAMPSAGQGWFKCLLPDAKGGSRYMFVLEGGMAVPDPASRAQVEILKGDSCVVDPAAHQWSDAAWTGRPWEEVVLSEIHVGTATPEGTFAALTAKLETFRDAGITAIELLPIADCPGERNWGYDGVLPFAPNAAYGAPDALKQLIDRAHGLNMMVFLDVVYNHFGPDGNYLPIYAKSFFTDRHQTPWGAGLNFDGEAGEVVREFFIHNALYWLEEFHFDGLRLDAVHAILDDSDTHILDEIATRVREAFPDRQVHLVLENEANEARRLVRTDGLRPLLYDAQWDDDIHHCWHRLLTGESESYYADFGGDTVARLGRCLAEGFAYQGEYSENLEHERGEPSKDLPPQAFVAFLQNHDQVGNRALGERLTRLAEARPLALARAALLLSPQIPMLFMGEEWGATTPFQFFVDFSDDPALSTAVRDGRRREFARFAAFSGERADHVPDPTDRATFLASKLDWRELDDPEHRAIFDETAGLLAIRRDEIVPLVKSGLRHASYRRLDEGGLQVTWLFAGGDLTFLANFGSHSLNLHAPVNDDILWRSAALGASGAVAHLPSWTGLVVRATL